MSSNTYETELSPRILKCLQNCEFVELKEFCVDEKNKHKVSQHGWDIITTLINHLKNETITNENIVYFRDIFSYIAAVSNPKEMLLAILEHFDPMIELDIVQQLIPAIIIVTQHLIEKDKKNHCYNIAMVVSALLYYLESLNMPNYTEFDPLKNTKELIEEIKIARFCQNCIDFGETVLNDVKKQLENEIIQDTHFNAIKQEIMNLCSGLLEVFIMIDADHRENIEAQHQSVCTNCTDNEDVNSDRKLSIRVAENLMLYTTTLNPSWVLLHNISWQRFLSFQRQPSPEELKKMNNARSSFLHFCLVKNLGNFPQVIDPVFAFIRCMPSILCLIDTTNFISINKGLELCRQVSNKLEPFCLKTAVINQELKPLKQNNITHFLLESFTKITINCEVKILRQRSLQFITRFLDKFVWQDRYNLLSYLLDNNEHFGLIGYLITYFKNKLDEVLKDGISEEGKIFLKKERFFKLVDVCLWLPHKSETDILAEYDKIMATLNLLLFLFIRDKENKTNIWSRNKSIESEYLNPLQTGINLSRMHFREEMKTQSKPKQKNETNFSVNGMNLTSMPLEERIMVLKTAISKFDMMQSVCARVQHFIDIRQKNS